MNNQSEIIALNTKEKLAAVNNFIDVLKFKTISGSGPLDGSYNDCVTWIRDVLVNDCKLDHVEIINESLENKPIVVGIWKGIQCTIYINLCIEQLNSHYLLFFFRQ